MITDTASKAALPAMKDQLYMISGFTRNKTEFTSETFEVDKILYNEELFVEQIVSVIPSSIRERTDAILKFLEHKSEHPGSIHIFHTLKDYPIGYCKNSEEFGYYLQHLEDLKLITNSQSGGLHIARVCITAEGWRYLQGIDQQTLASPQAFIAMWFEKHLNKAFSDGIKPLEKETGFTMIRIDKKPFNDKICDRIMAEIRKSRFVIADVTGQRIAVYFEAGFARGLNIPVIWTCNENEKDEVSKSFDTRQYNHIFWKNPMDLKDQLKDRILGTFGTYQGADAL